MASRALLAGPSVRARLALLLRTADLGDAPWAEASHCVWTMPHVAAIAGYVRDEHSAYKAATAGMPRSAGERLPDRRPSVNPSAQGACVAGGCPAVVPCSPIVVFVSLGGRVCPRRGDGSRFRGVRRTCCMCRRCIAPCSRARWRSWGCIRSSYRRRPAGCRPWCPVRRS